MFWYKIFTEKYISDMEKEKYEEAERVWTAFSDMESKIADLSYINKGLQEELNSIRKEMEYKNLLDGDMKADFTVLNSSNPKLLSELYNLCKNCQYTVITNSLKIRKVDGIAYRDGAVDGLEILKARFKEFYRNLTDKNKKESTEE